MQTEVAQIHERWGCAPISPTLSYFLCVEL
jgi:hypothetical protein